MLVATDRYDAWLISWPPGTDWTAHDHGVPAGAVVITTGRLDEDTSHDGVTVTTPVEPERPLWSGLAASTPS